MSYKRIHQVLASDSMFAPKVVDKDTEVEIRENEKVHLPALVVSVYNALKASGCGMQSMSKTMILATAASLDAGAPMPIMAPPVPLVQPQAKKKPEVAKPESRPLQSTSKPVVVTTVRAGSQRPPAERVLDTECVQRYQCAVASAQLLAALHQLFDKDDFPGHEQRKRKLDDLITDVEQASSTHVNLSVKAIIRAQTHQAKTAV